MKFGLDVATTGAYTHPRTIVDLAVDAEQAGWDGFFVWDVLLSGVDGGTAEPALNPWITLAAVAAATKRIRLGVFVAPLPRRRPWQVATEATTLDHLSGGRLIFAAGLGFRPEEFRAIGEDPDPKTRAERLDEALEIIDRLWQGEPVTFHGSHFHLDAARLLPKPVQQLRIPIWTAAGWPRRRPLRRAARYDGVYLMTVNQDTDELLSSAEVAQIAEYLSQQGASDGFDIAINGELSSDDHAATIAQYEQAGATWWIELSPDTPDQYAERIRQGPPTALGANPARR